LTPRSTTMLIFIGPRPATAAASIPRQHALAREADVVNRSEHLVVEAVEADGDPAQSSLLERRRLLASAEPLVVMATSSSPGIPASLSASRSTSRRTSGSPPVRRTFARRPAARRRRRRRGRRRLAVLAFRQGVEVALVVNAGPSVRLRQST
jgi:hypothetical protein